MTEKFFLGLVGVIVAGISAQWLAWRLKFPSILLLLIFGIVAGPVTGLINPDELLGELLFPVVSLSVAIILFEGGLSLKFSDLKATGSVVHRLITTGALVSWFGAAAAAHYILGFDLPLAVLLGAILVVTGPTVIIPLLMHVRPSEKVASVLKWEGILIDPIGAVLAVLVYEAILAGQFHAVPELAIQGIIYTLYAGIGIGAAAAFFLVLMLKYYWVPDFLHNPVALLLVVCSFSISNLLQPESGFLAVTVMGALLSNQKSVAIKHIIEFKENLRVLLIAILFILLAARLSTDDLKLLTLGSFAFLVVLIAVVRPLSVLVSTFFSRLKWRERGFIAFIAPRGIVAAAVASVFAIRMVEAGYPQAEKLLPVTYMVIIGTVLFYGLGASAISRGFKVAQARPQGFFLLGAPSWAVTIAEAIKDAGYKVIVTDTNPSSVFFARMRGVSAYYGNGLSERIFMDVDMEGIGRLLALTPNDGINSLAVLRFNEVFDRSELYQLAPRKKEERAETKEVPKHLSGRFLFWADINYDYLSMRFASGAVLKKSRLTEEFDFEAFKERSKTAIPLFLIDEEGNIFVFTPETALRPRPGHTLISLVDRAEE